MPKRSKSIKISKFVQGEKDAELFALVGAWAVSPTVHNKLGICVSALPGDVWYVSETGFLNLRARKNGGVHVRYLHADAAGDAEAMLKAALDDYRESEVIYTNDRKSATIWKKHGFTAIEKKTGGEFCRWEKKNS